MAQSIKQQIGALAEEVAVKHFVKHQFRILDRNYRKKWGEIDIVAQKDDILHFIEVKAVSCETFLRPDSFQPEENMHFWKRKRLLKAIQTYLSEKEVSCETEWQIDVAGVFLDFRTRKAKIRVTENVIL